MTWFYNNHSGALINESPPAPEYFVLEGLLHLGNGWHAYGSEAEVDAAVAANHWPAPTTSAGTQISNAESGAAGAAKSAVTKVAKAATSSVSGLISDVTSRALWTRVAKVAVGIALVVAGVAQLVHIQSIASTVGKAVPLA
jgi:hypothetical protein